jgi:ribosome-binding protein aMBF1 (putative translation factor)
MNVNNSPQASTDFGKFVEDVERNADESERALLQDSRRRFGIGSKLLAKRMAAGLSQRELAAASGIDQAEISRIENGQANPTVQTLQALGNPLGVTLDFSAAPANSG